MSWGRLARIAAIGLVLWFFPLPPGPPDNFAARPPRRRRRRAVCNRRPSERDPGQASSPDLGRIMVQEDWLLIDVDGIGHLEIQRDDERHGSA